MTAEFAGTLRERIMIERPGPARTTTGLSVEQWEPVATCQASITPDGAGRESQGMALSAMPRFALVVRARNGLAIDQRVRWRGRTLAIRQIVDDPTLADRLMLRCEEVRS